MDKKKWDKVNNLFHAALEKDSRCKSKFLDEACANDPSLRAEVEALLKTDSSVGDFLETPPQISGTYKSFESYFVGKQVGAFIIQRVISSGGMGTVYEALQEKPKRSVALKMMKEEIASTSALHRFEYESQILAKLNHPGVAKIFESGMHSDTSSGADVIHKGVPFFVMELIPNALSITQYASLNDLDIHEKLHLFFQVCDAVNHGHQRGIIHRDLKPANILVDNQGQVKIIDFGIARATEPDVARTVLETATGQLIGTVQYMSPEQCGDNPQDIDVRSDIYTLGVVLYELLSGKTPYDLNKTSLYETIRMIREDAPIRPGTACISLRGDLEIILLKAINKDRNHRYQTAIDLAADIRHFLAREPIQARRDSTLYVIRKRLMRRPIVTALTAIVILISIAAGLFAHRSFINRQAVKAAEGQRALDLALVEALCGRYNQVELLLKEAETNDIYPGRISMLRGLAAMETRDYVTAGKELAKAVDLLPESLGAVALFLRLCISTGRFEEVPKLNEKLQSLKPVTVEDYLYGGFIIGPVSPELAIEWLEYAAKERPTPAVQLLLGTQRFFVLLETYDAEQIDLTMATLFAAKTQLPGNLLSSFLLAFADIAAADIYRLKNDMVRSSFYLTKAKEEAQHLMEENPEHSYPYKIAAMIALYENNLDQALVHIRSAVTRPDFWPMTQFFIPQLLYQLGRYEEALAVLNQMPPPYKISKDWCIAATIVTAEVNGIDAAKACYQTWQIKSGSNMRPFGRDLEYKAGCFFGQLTEAVRSNQEYIQKAGPPLSYMSPDPFKIALDRYVCGELSADELLQTAKKRFQRNHANYLIGLTLLSEGKRIEAKSRFATVERAGNMSQSYS